MDNPSLVIVPGMDGTGVFLDGLVSELGDCCDVTVVRYPADLPLGYEELTRVALKFVPEGRPVVLQKRGHVWTPPSTANRALF